MSSIAELAERLLPTSGSESAETATHHARRSQATAEPVRARPPSFSDGYVPIDGVPGKVLKPSAEGSRFKCQAYSRDKCRFATGESNGTVRLWTAVGCPTLTASFAVSEGSIEHLAFSLEYDDVVSAVLDSGKVICIRFNGGENAEPEPTKKLERWIPTEEDVFDEMDAICRCYNVNSSRCSFQQHRELQLSEDGHTVAFLIVAWDANSVTTEYLVWNKVFRFHQSTEQWRQVVDDSGSIRRQRTSRPTTGEGMPFSKIFSLSKNGHGLISTSQRVPNAIDVYRSLCVDKSCPGASTINDAYAAWGLDGRYLVLWKLLVDDTFIALYETEIQGSHFPNWSSLAERSLGPGVMELDVRMLDHSSDDGHLEILVAEIHASAETRIYLWNATENKLTLEVHLPRGPQLSIAGETETDHEAGSTKSNSGHSFCISKDRKRIGTLCGSLGTCSLLSVVSGAVVSQVQISESDKEREKWIFRDITFDASERHLVLFSEQVILALAPAALNRDVPLIPRTNRCEDMMAEQSKSRSPQWLQHKKGLHASIQLFSMFSPEAFDFAVVNHLIDLFSFKLCFGQPNNRRHFSNMFQRIKSAGHSAKWDYIACIADDHPDSSRTSVVIWQLTSEAVLPPHDFAGLKFPLASDSGDAAAGFVTAKLVFYLTDNAEDRMALLPLDYRPAVILCHLPEESFEVLNLEMEKCLAFRQTENQQQLCILGSNRVCFLDLQSKSIVSSVVYRVNFCELFAMAAETQTGEMNWEHYFEHRRTRLLASDGRTVLLAWDMINERGITVTPSTEPQECKEYIAEAGDGLNLDCGISGSGRCGHCWTAPAGANQIVAHFCIFSLSGTRSREISLLLGDVL